MKNKKLLLAITILFFIGLIQAVSFLLPAAASDVFYNIIRPICFVVLLLLTVLFIGIGHGVTRHGRMSFTILVFGGIIYVGLLFVAVLLTSLGKNPMTANASVLLTNLWQYVPFVVAGEIIRYCLMRGTPKEHKNLMLWLITVVYSFTMINFTAHAFSLEFIIVAVAPVIGINFFLTYVCASGSLAGVIIFRAAYSLIPVFMPVLPNITNLTLAILTYVTIIVMLSLYSTHVRDHRLDKPSHKRISRKWWLAVPLVLVLFVVTVNIIPTNMVAVASDSMKGEFNRGDMVVMRKLSPEKAATTLKTGDIIRFKDGKIEKIHRIVEVGTDQNGEVQYITKGDNNDRADWMPVKPEDILGIAQFKIPYLGFPSVIMRTIFT